MSRFPVFSPALLALLAVSFGSIGRADVRVWSVTETRRVLRSEAPGDTRNVAVAAARNEWVGFQIAVRSAAPVPQVSLAAGELRGPAGVELTGARARLYRQHQLRLDVGSNRNDNFIPDWYPDPLIPFEHPVAGHELAGARFTAVPFDLPAGETHAFWVDIFVPADAAPGDYTATYRLTGDGIEDVNLPVALRVWNFTLPATPTLATEFGSHDTEDGYHAIFASPFDFLRQYYRKRAKAAIEREPSDWPAVEAQLAALTTEHKLNAAPPERLLTPVVQPDGSFRIPTVPALREFIDRYQINALQIPHPEKVIRDPEAERERLRAWLAAFDRAAAELNRPHVVFFAYLRDEPNSLEDYRYVQRWGKAIRETGTVVKVLVVEQTWTEPGRRGADSNWGDLYGAVDIWCPLFSLQRQESAAERQALGETIWAYTALCQGDQPTPWWQIDYPLLNYRVPAWMAWREGISGLLYWGLLYWGGTDDPWSQAPSLRRRGSSQQPSEGDRIYRIFLGEGSLVYPARAVGYDGVVPTIRLKALRDAIEDYEYLALLERAGKRSEAEKIVRSLTESWVQWEKEPAAYEKARAALAGLLQATMVERRELWTEDEPKRLPVKSAR